MYDITLKSEYKYVIILINIKRFQGDIMMISREHLELLSQNFRNIDETTKEIINLEAILSLPKGTEHFLSDIHGEYEAFDHILRNGSGVIKEKLKEVFGNRLPKKELNLLATIIYYPEEKLKAVLRMPEAFSELQGNVMYVLVADTLDEMREMEDFVGKLK